MTALARIPQSLTKPPTPKRKKRRKKNPTMTHEAISAARQEAEPPHVSLKVLRGLTQLHGRLQALLGDVDPTSDEGYAMLWLARFSVWHIARWNKERIAKVTHAS